jgi:hypothetical protein
MKISEYNLDNWRELLEKDWEYLRQDNGSGNVENIFNKILNEISDELGLVSKILEIKHDSP